MKLRTVVPIGIALVALLGISARGIPRALSYYMTPSEVVAHGGQDLGQIRVGGLVEAGSVRQQGDQVRFVLTDGSTSIPVVQTGSVPPLFRGGVGAIVEGTYGADGVFSSQDVMVKHDEVYTAPSPGQAVP